MGLESWKFLEGKWKARAVEENSFGEEGVVEGDTEVHTLLTVMFYDEEAKLLRRKAFFSYGFVNNEVEIESSEGFVRFQITMEPVTEFFKGTVWRSYIRKVSDDVVLEGLESSKDGVEYTLFGETRMERVK